MQPCDQKWEESMEMTKVPHPSKKVNTAKHRKSVIPSINRIVSSCSSIVFLYRNKTLSGEGALGLIYKTFHTLQVKADKYIFLRELYFTDIDLHCAFVSKYLREVLPIIYTPVVGHVISNYCELIKDDRGNVIRYQPASEFAIDDHEVITWHMSYMEPILEKNFPKGHNKTVMIVTDSQAILGIGDQGYGGIEICFGKGKVDTVGGGVNPT
jgi:malate dehydrogenase (oxaloacetate-decarboxylating)